MNEILTCSFPLPHGFRHDDMLAFHRRDPQQVAERVTTNCVQKGLVWEGLPAGLSLEFTSARVEAHLAIDGRLSDDSQYAIEAIVRRMLGLDQPIEAFEERYRHHPQLRRLIVDQAGLRVPVTATPFEALSWAVAGQQISVAAAVSLRRKLILAAGVRHSGGLFCYPQAPQVLALEEGALRRAGFSATKAATLLSLCRLVVTDELPLAEWTQTLRPDKVRETLLAVKGIGPWTLNYLLLRGFGWLDGSLHGDVAVRRGLQRLLAAPERLDAAETEAWLAQFSPWRALVAAHLWALRAALVY